MSTNPLPNLTANNPITQAGGFASAWFQRVWNQLAAWVDSEISGATSALVTAVHATAPLSSSGGTAPTISHDTSGASAGTYKLATVTVNATGHVTSISAGVGDDTIYTVATLPAVVAGLRAFVSDANATTFASIVAGSGSNFVPVYCDGTNWLIG